jgi:hypothetical protein
MKKLLLASIFLVVWTPSAFAGLSQVYVGQTAIGSADGTSCASALPVTFFNSSGNWGSGGSQIAPGTTVHLCGTISTPLTAQGGGVSGSPITILFEPNAKISMGTCNTVCLNLNKRSYIVVDGGTNGVIEETANGTGFATHNDDSGIQANAVSNIEIRKLTIQNIYKYVCCGNDGAGRSIDIVGATQTSIHHNIIHDSTKCIFFALGGGISQSSGNTIYKNTIYNCSWNIMYASGSGGIGTVSDNNASIHDNDLQASSLFCTGVADYYHNDVLTVFTQTGSDNKITNLLVYNNYVHGEVCPVGGSTNYSAIFKFSTDVSPANVTATIFNNLIVVTGLRTSDGLICVGNGNAQFGVYNNTLDATGGDPANQIGIEGSPTVTFTAKNNIMNGVRYGVYLSAQPVVTMGDTNNYYSSNGAYFSYGGGFLNLSQWQTSCSCDFKSITSVPNLNASYSPNTGSPVIGVGTNLTSLGIVALNFDKAGVLRPLISAWDLGAYSYSSATRSLMAPSTSPSGLRVK